MSHTATTITPPVAPKARQCERCKLPFWVRRANRTRCAHCLRGPCPDCGGAKNGEAERCRGCRDRRQLERNGGGEGESGVGPPTSELPASVGKVDVMVERAANGLALFNPMDAVRNLQ